MCVLVAGGIVGASEVCWCWSEGRCGGRVRRGCVGGRGYVGVGVSMMVCRCWYVCARGVGVLCEVWVCWWEG